MPTRRPTGDLYIFHDYTYFATRKELLKLPSVTTLILLIAIFLLTVAFLFGLVLTQLKRIIILLLPCHFEAFSSHFASQVARQMSY